MAVAALALSLVALGGGDPPVMLGRSHDGRPVMAQVLGSPRAARRVVVVGCIHGDECAGQAIVRRLASVLPPPGVAFWLVPNLNPDGTARGVRQNGRGVDLNRNFPSEWRERGRRWDAEYSGPRPGSERETRIAMNLVRRVRPQLTIWLHQPQAVVRAWGPSVAAARRYAGLAREPYRSIRWPAGTAPNWQNHAFPSAAAFVVELPAGPLSAAGAARHARAVRALAQARPAAPRRASSAPFRAYRLRHTRAGRDHGLAACARRRRPLQVSVVVPDGWTRVRRPPTTLLDPVECLAVTNFPLRQARPDTGCRPVTAMRQMRPDAVMVEIVEFGPIGMTPRSGFPMRPRHFRLRSRDPVGGECFGWQYQLPFRQNGRLFWALLLTRERRPPAAVLRQGLAILDSLRVEGG